MRQCTDPEAVKDLVKHLKGGATFSLACDLAGVSYGYFRRLRTKAEKAFLKYEEVIENSGEDFIDYDLILTATEKRYIDWYLKVTKPWAENIKKRLQKVYDCEDGKKSKVELILLGYLYPRSFGKRADEMPEEKEEETALQLTPEEQKKGMRELFLRDHGKLVNVLLSDDTDGALDRTLRDCLRNNQYGERNSKPLQQMENSGL